jgi:hypothetical protein
MKLSKRELSGFALAPLPVVAPLLLMFGVIISSAPPDSGAAFEAGAQLVLGSYVATLLLGLPIHLILRWKGRHSLAAYLGFTVLGGRTHRWLGPHLRSPLSGGAREQSVRFHNVGEIRRHRHTRVRCGCVHLCFHFLGGSSQANARVNVRFGSKADISSNYGVAAFAKAVRSRS